MQRVYYMGENKQEATLVFMYPPSNYFFETLTTSRLLKTTYKQLQEIINQYPEIQRMVLQLTTFALKGVLERQAELQCFSAEEKFRSLLKRSPHVLQLIPHKYLASYLGIDPATFSKLLGSIRI